MAISSNMICCYDMETSSANPYTTMPLELAAIMVNPKTLTIIQGSEFQTLIKPCDGWEKVEPQALEKNKIDPEEVKIKGLDEKIAFESFIKYLKKYSKSSNVWHSPLRAGHNIGNFDDIIIARLAIKYKQTDKEGRPKVFHPFHYFDTISICHQWFESLDEPGTYNLDDLRRFFGIPVEGSHRAMKDVEDTAKIMCRFINFQRTITQKNKPKFKDCFRNA